jgi:hypothetical protein
VDVELSELEVFAIQGSLKLSMFHERWKIIRTAIERRLVDLGCHTSNMFNADMTFRCSNGNLDLHETRQLLGLEKSRFRSIGS